MLFLTDALALRRATVWPAYREDVALPWVYGRASLTPVPLDATGEEWLVADHPVLAVERVSVAGVETDGWQLIHRLDATGQAIAVLRLAQPPKDGVKPAVRVAGRRHPVTGQLLEHPAEIAADLLRQAGWSVPQDAFSGLREDYPGLALGVVLAEAQTLRAAVDGVISPLGASWSAPDLRARRAAPADAASSSLTPRHCETLSAQAEAGDLATEGRVTYAYDWAAGRATAGLVLEAPDAIQRYGRLSVDIDLPAVRTARDALMVAQLRLQDLARARWTLSASLTAREVPALLDTVAITHPHVPAGQAWVSARRVARDQLSASLTLQMPAGACPRVVLVRQTRAIDASEDVLAVSYLDGVASFTILAADGTPLVGASVSLDGADTRMTDRTGTVQFRTTRGSHVLTVVATGYAPYEMEVTV